MSVGLHIGEWYPDAYHTTTRETATLCLCLCLRTPTSRTDRQHKQGGGKPNTRLRSGVEMFSPGGEYVAALYCTYRILILVNEEIPTRDSTTESSIRTKSADKDKEDMHL
jgi:hypothetical protein